MHTNSRPRPRPGRRSTKTSTSIIATPHPHRPTSCPCPLLPPPLRTPPSPIQISLPPTAVATQAQATSSPHPPPSSGPTSSRGWTQITHGRCVRSCAGRPASSSLPLILLPPPRHTGVGGGSNGFSSNAANANPSGTGVNNAGYEPLSFASADAAAGVLAQTSFAVSTSFVSHIHPPFSFHLFSGFDSDSGGGKMCCTHLL
ncbi:hypothetical protein DFH08DRAFT_39639 [Mycena albidolilacea]|uniref:Uncharacterized protein n=1 Tax=Mycena albidolilacea TaxID=1033008 RepID=A0AAD7AW91_9AGAR|nr:hypothetical protein DFH08DRAFT_39639 [Mycena albidolilacea]